jgi:PhnB protein
MAKKAKAKRPAARSRSARKAAPRKARKVEAIPRRYGALVPAMVVRGASAALAFYAKAFGAKEMGGRMQGPDGKIMHAEFRIGDRVVMISDEMLEMGAKSPQTLGGSPASLLIYVRDADAVFRRAIEAGARSLQEPADQFWGDRWGRLVDPFGHEWQVATHIADLSQKQMAAAMQTAMAAGQPGQG